jgi:hypothetical protein
MMPCNGARLYDDFSNMLKGTRYEHEPYLRVEWLIDCHEMLILNAIGIGDCDDILKRNQALLLVGSFFNHSDRPNCHWTEDNGKVVFKASRVIEEGEQVFISYSNDRNILERIYRIPT